MIGNSSRVALSKPMVDVLPLIDLNPLHWLGDKAQEGLADGFASMMVGLWSAGVGLLQMAFALVDSFTPNVADPDLGSLYAITVWVGLVVALTMATGQIGVAVLRQDGRGFGTLLAGVVQYGLVVSCWVGVFAAVITGTSGLSDAILHTLLGVDSFSGYAAGDGFVDTVSGTVQAATLGVCALFLVIPAAFGHIIIMLVRSAALLILTATMPIAAAGALSESTRSWMWKSIRWFLACALMQPLLALVLGLGTQFAWSGMPDGTGTDQRVGAEVGAEVGVSLGRGVGAGLARVDAASSTAQNIGLSVVGSVILLISCFAPLVLFRLLAFVDPGTASGASFRTTMNANGGVSGLLRGDRHGAGSAGGAAAQGAGSGAASETASDGRTTSENGADAQTANRWQAATLAKGSRAGGKAVGKVGAVIGGAMEKTARVAQVGASMGVDVLGQSGIGNQGYYDLSRSPEEARSRHHQAHRMQQSHDPAHASADSSGEASGGTGGGAAHDVPAPTQAQVQATAEDGAFLA